VCLGTTSLLGGESSPNIKSIKKKRCQSYFFFDFLTFITYILPKSNVNIHFTLVLHNYAYPAVRLSLVDCLATKKCALKRVYKLYDMRLLDINNVK
jgi:hypothetical protein